MLPFFPTPYPDELWYSVLCRYHVRTGNTVSKTTIKELFHGRKTAPITSFLPTRVISDIKKQLPEGIIDVEDIALNHTLFKYVFRFKNLDEKKDLLERAISGFINYPIKFSKSNSAEEIRACPLCINDDMEKYGESYWHVSHQIDSVSVCHKHGCRLIVKKKNYRAELSHNFFIPNDIKGDIDFNVPEHEVVFARILTQYLELPLEIGPTEGYNNLYIGLINAGYGIARKEKDYNYSIDYKRLTKGIIANYGEDFLTKNFGKNEISVARIGTIRNWSRKAPNMYAVLAMFINQDPFVTFSSIQTEIEMSKKLLELSKCEIIPAKTHIANILGVRPKTLDIIANNLGIEPFWNQKPDVNNPKTKRISIGLTEEEQKIFNEYIKKHSFQNNSDFIRFGIKKAIEYLDGI